MLNILPKDIFNLVCDYIPQKDLLFNLSLTNKYTRKYVRDYLSKEYDIFYILSQLSVLTNTVLILLNERQPTYKQRSPIYRDYSFCNTCGLYNCICKEIHLPCQNCGSYNCNCFSNYTNNRCLHCGFFDCICS